MDLKLITFDCANTLLQNHYDPFRFACDLVVARGVVLPVDAGSRFHSLVQKHSPSLLEMNRKKSLSAWEESFQVSIADWLDALGAESISTDLILEEAKWKLLSQDSPLFQPFEDTIETLQELKREGFQLAVISNWDVTLYPILEAHQLAPYFDYVAASLCEGVEKPDPKLFEIVLERLDVDAEDCLHVGDDPVDDLQGASNAGIHGILIDRTILEPQQPVISSLRQLKEAISWYF